MASADRSEGEKGKGQKHGLVTTISFIVHVKIQTLPSDLFFLSIVVACPETHKCIRNIDYHVLSYKVMS